MIIETRILLEIESDINENINEMASQTPPGPASSASGDGGPSPVKKSFEYVPPSKGQPVVQVNAFVPAASDVVGKRAESPGAYTPSGVSPSRGM